MGEVCLPTHRVRLGTREGLVTKASLPCCRLPGPPRAACPGGPGCPGSGVLGRFHIAPPPSLESEAKW